MTFRRFLLLARLVALGLCAGVGVLAVFVSTGEFLWEVLGTAIDTAVATGLLLPLSLLISREKFRVGSLAGMGVVLAAWLCILAAIWLSDLRPHDLSERFAVTALFVLFMGVPSAGVLLLLSFRQARVAVLTFVTGAIVAWVFCVIDAWLLFGSIGERFMASGMVIYGINTLAAALLVNLGCGDKRYFRWAGVAAAVCGLAMALWDIWALQVNEDYFWRLVVTVIVPAAVMAHFNLVFMARLRASQEWLKWAVCAFSLCSGLMLMFVLLRPDFDRPHELLSRGSAAAGIVAACGSLALIVLAVLNRKTDLASLGPGALEATTLDLTCPRCRLRQTVAFGESACAQCELQFTIKVTEPRCPACGYLLYRLTSGTCPECGAAVRTGAGMASNTPPMDAASP
jgi:hypothetical protein